MNKGDLVNQVAKVVSTKKEAQAVVDCVFDSIKKALKKKVLKKKVVVKKKKAVKKKR